MLDLLKQELLGAIRDAVKTSFGATELPPLSLGLPPQAELGDFTFETFPLARVLRRGPPQIAAALQKQLQHPALKKVEAAGPYLNLTLDQEVLFGRFIAATRNPSKPFGTHAIHAGKRVMVEFSSPNTNKPLHIGHLRNNLLGWSVTRLLEAVGYEVIRACLVNDRGIHICKSMLGYQKFFAPKTPSTQGIKGDHFVGDCYVAFEKARKAEEEGLRQRLSDEGISGEALDKALEDRSSLMQEARTMLRQWEAGDPDTRALWQTMNGWVYEGFETTYKAMGVHFDRFYHESALYERGKAIVLDALEAGKVQRRPDGTVVMDLSSEGLDPKVLLRSDGTSLYITQDIGVALKKWEDYQCERSIYVIGNEQDHQMRTLFLTLKHLGYTFADGLFHLSYGMVELPEGRMKSREGRVIDTDDLIAELTQNAREELLKRAAPAGEDPTAEPLLSDEALSQRAYSVAMGGIKFFFLKVNPRRDFTFHPSESIQFQGDTGPYVQYTHARIRSMLRKAAALGLDYPRAAELGALKTLGNPEERALLRCLLDFPRAVSEAAEKLQPSTVATWMLEAGAAFNRFYHAHPVLRAEQPEVVLGRLALCEATASVLSRALDMLGIEAPEEM